MLCPRWTCEVWTGPPKTKPKRVKDISPSNKRNSAKLDCLADVERALSESKDSASAVSVSDRIYLFWCSVAVV